MLSSGLTRISPHAKDFSLLHSYGAAVPDTGSLPSSFSVFSGGVIPNQLQPDARFSPPLPPLPMACTGETGAFESGIQDGGILYDPKYIYDHTPPGGLSGRDIREMLSFLIDSGPRAADGTPGPRRTAYFNVYGSSDIDDFDAARIALWINQSEKRGVYVGSYWYWSYCDESGILPIPSFNTRIASLHCYLCTGWKEIGGKPYLEMIPWIGEGFGDKGKCYMSRELYNGLMGQPWTGAFTITKLAGTNALPIGYQAVIDHLVYFIRSLFKVSSALPLPAEKTMEVAPVPPPPVVPEASLYDCGTPERAYHSVRMLCDAAGLSVAQKNLLCACIYQESEFQNRAIGRNRNKNGVITSTDWGICQVNDTPGWNIGTGLEFPSVQYVLDHPEECVRWMIRMYKAGKLRLWASYSTGAYKPWLSPDSPMWKLKQNYT